MTRTPNTPWISQIRETSDWELANDPCNIELGNTWHVPTYTEWLNVQTTGGWTTATAAWASALKIHAAGNIGNEGQIAVRGYYGWYFSNMMYIFSSSEALSTNAGGVCQVTLTTKGQGVTLRCIRDN